MHDSRDDKDLPPRVLEAIEHIVSLDSGPIPPATREDTGTYYTGPYKV